MRVTITSICAILSLLSVAIHASPNFDWTYAPRKGVRVPRNLAEGKPSSEVHKR